MYLQKTTCVPQRFRGVDALDEILKLGFVQNTVIVGIVFAEEAAEFGQELFVPLELEVEENLFLMFLTGGTARKNWGGRG